MPTEIWSTSPQINTRRISTDVIRLSVCQSNLRVLIGWWTVACFDWHAEHSFIYKMSLWMCTTQANRNWMYALKKSNAMIQGVKKSFNMMNGQNCTRHLLLKSIDCAHTRCSWIGSRPGEVLVEVVMRNFCCTQLFFLFTHPYVTCRSSTQHSCKIIRSPSYPNYNRPICE